jgi:hypothetical protein
MVRQAGVGRRLCARAGARTSGLGRVVLILGRIDFLEQLAGPPDRATLNALGAIVQRFVAGLARIAGEGGPATVRRLPDSFKLEHPEPFGPIDRALVALGREGQPVSVKLEESDLIGAEAAVVPSNIDVISFAR